jgi:hypothetical protein
MKLVGLVTFFSQGGTFEAFCNEHALNAESEVIEIYAQEPVNLDAQLGFFPIEETEGRIEFESQGKKYRNLFDFFYFMEVLEEVKGGEEPNTAELAERLFSYATKDA